MLPRCYTAILLYCCTAVLLHATQNEIKPCGSDAADAATTGAAEVQSSGVACAAHASVRAIVLLLFLSPWKALRDTWRTASLLAFLMPTTRAAICKGKWKSQMPTAASRQSPSMMCAAITSVIARISFCTLTSQCNACNNGQHSGIVTYLAPMCSDGGRRSARQAASELP